MKKKIVLALIMMSLGVSLVAGCGSSTEEESSEVAVDEVIVPAEETEEAETEDATETEDAVGMANPWTESDEQGVAEATGFDMVAPEGATDVVYSYMSEDGLAQMCYVLDGAEWTYRIQMADELTDISGLYYTWDSELEGTVSDREAVYYGYAGDDGYVQLVNWYDAVTGVTYSLSASGDDLDGMDIQVFAENIYVPLQGEATDDPEGDREAELNDYFLGEHIKSEDESSLSITDNNDGTFDVDISITRLCSLENGVGTFEEHKMYFEVEDPSGNTLKGMIYRDNDNSLTIKITDSTWELLPNDEVIQGFGK